MSLRTASRGSEHLVDLERSEQIYLVIRDHMSSTCGRCGSRANRSDAFRRARWGRKYLSELEQSVRSEYLELRKTY